MIWRCSSLASSEPELLLPVSWTARCNGVEPLLFMSRRFAPFSMRALTVCGATGPHGTMQRSHAALVHRVGISTLCDEVSNHLTLLIPIPMGRTGTTICGVVGAVRRLFGCERGYQHLAQRRTLSVLVDARQQRHVVPCHRHTRSVESNERSTCWELERPAPLRELNWWRDQVFVYPSLDPETIVRRDRTEEREQRTVVEPIDPMRLRHLHSLPES